MYNRLDSVQMAAILKRGAAQETMRFFAQHPLVVFGIQASSRVQLPSFLLYVLRFFKLDALLNS